MGDVIARIDEEDIRGLFESSEDRLRHCQPQLDVSPSAGILMSFS